MIDPIEMREYENEARRLRAEMLRGFFATLAERVKSFGLGAAAAKAQTRAAP